MKVVVITHNYIRRQGDLTALYLHRLSSGLIEKGIEITVVCPHAPGLLTNDVIDGVKIKRFSYPFSNIKPLVYSGHMHEEVAKSLFAKFVFLGLLKSFYSFALKVCREEKADLIWANWWIPPGLAAARIAQKLGIPLVISSHGTDIALLSKPGITGKLSKYVYKRTSRATVVSTFLKEQLIKRVPYIKPDKIDIIPMPVGMEHFPLKEFKPKEIPIFLSVARYTRQKRLFDIVYAADILNKEGLKFNIIMVGEGPLKTELHQVTQEKGIAESFTIGPLVAQQKLAQLYQECDCVLLVSEGEGFGLILVEAGLTGRPVIGSKSGGITDVLRHDVNGLLIDLGDVNMLAKHMKSIILDIELKKRLGKEAHCIATEKFGTPVIVEKVYQLFDQIIRRSDN
ncbi:MAG: glycosyltransferase family 4 protein [candidate division Zixibacteria bacterium]|nr:glycosyltransferase family 4 protein [candidate division Zixibacteria bacterium]